MKNTDNTFQMFTKMTLPTLGAILATPFTLAWMLLQTIPTGLPQWIAMPCLLFIAYYVIKSRKAEAELKEQVTREKKLENDRKLVELNILKKENNL